MKKKDRKKTNKYLLTIITILCVAAMAFTATDILPVAPLRRAAGTVTSPIQRGIDKIGSWLSTKYQSRRDANELASDNERLRDRVAALEEENTLLRENQEELERLRELYALDGDYAGYEKVAAQVISRDPGNWYTSFMINRGSDAGIETDMNVIASGGLVGIITEVGANWAYVRPITDEGASVSAMTMTNAFTCVVSGSIALQTEGKLGFEQMHTDSTAEPGEKIVTSSISEKYLEGILIGYVDTVGDGPNHLTKTGTIIPAVDFEHIDEVFVILDKKMP